MNLEGRITSISKRFHLGHIGSCLSVLPILESIYKMKKPEDKVMLSGGHAHLAHLVVREKYEGLKNIERLIERDIHCNRESGCDVTTGSLGHSGIAVGLALANRDRDVYLVLTDGSLGEGSEWEALRIKRELQLTNLKVFVNMNGYTAASAIDKGYLRERILAFSSDTQIWNTYNGNDFEGVQGHYRVLE